MQIQSMDAFEQGGRRNKLFNCIRSVPYVSIVGFVLSLAALGTLSEELRQVFKSFRVNVLTPEAIVYRDLASNMEWYMWTTVFLGFIACSCNLLVAVFGTGWVFEKCCEKKTLKNNPGQARNTGLCSTYVRRFFIVFQALLVLIVFVLSMLTVILVAMGFLVVGIQDLLQSACLQHSEHAHTTNTTQMPLKDAHCINLSDFHQEFQNICDKQLTVFCEEVVSKQDDANTIFIASILVCLSMLLLLGATPANYVRFRLSGNNYVRIRSGSVLGVGAFMGNNGRKAAGKKKKGPHFGNPDDDDGDDDDREENIQYENKRLNRSGSGLGLSDDDTSSDIQDDVLEEEFPGESEFTGVPTRKKK